MDNTKQYAQSLQGIFDKIKEIDDLLRGSQYGYKLTSVLETHASLFDRFCPYNVGDRVKLIKAPEINERVAPGWTYAKHFLIEGAIATVQLTDYRKDHFFFGLEFDDDSWIDRDNIVRPIDSNRRGVFYFSEDYLTTAND